MCHNRIKHALYNLCQKRRIVFDIGAAEVVPAFDIDTAETIPAVPAAMPMYFR